MVGVGVAIAAVAAFAATAANAATPTTPPLRRVTASLAIRDLPNAWAALGDITWGPPLDDTLGFLARVTAPTCVPVEETADYLLSLVALPRGFAYPLHSRPGITALRALRGSLWAREMSVLQFVDGGNDGDAPASASASAARAFAHEDVFARGEDEAEDCVCRGGRCPRREGCVFWVNKRLRDAAASLAVQERGLRLLSPADPAPTVWPEDAGPREYLRVGPDDNTAVYGSGGTVATSGADNGGAAVFLEVYVKNAEEADFIEPAPPLQVCAPRALLLIALGTACPSSHPHRPTSNRGSFTARTGWGRRRATPCGYTRCRSPWAWA
jgi:hypothetical protein